MEPSTIFSVIKLVFGPIVKAGKWVGKGIQRGIFRWHDRKPSANEITALRLARSVLGGSIISALPFRNLGSKNQFLAVVRTEHDDSFSARMHVLEQVGGAYMQRWVSEEVYGTFDKDSIKVVDLDNDGIKEIIFESESYGTGAGSKSLYIYSVKKNQVFEITEFYNFSDASTPEIYPIEIDIEADEPFRQTLINFASSRGFLRGNELVDYDDPKFSILRWHKENGEKRSGKISVHLYNGKPMYGGGSYEEIDAANIIWTAYFKGPLFGYIKSKDKHFIPYSPRWVYEWVTSLADDGKRLWFICHGVSGLFSFEYLSNILKHYCGYSGYALPDGDEIILENNILYFYPMTVGRDRSLVVEIDSLNDLQECYPTCMLNEPHLPNQCLSQRHRESLQTLIGLSREKQGE